MREARTTDAAACAAILRDWAAETPWYPRSDPPEAREGAVAARMRQGLGIVAESDRIDGFILLEGGYVACLYVARGARGKGLGARLLDAAKELRPALLLWTHAANTGARAFYEREGFVATGASDGADNAERLPDIEYVWRQGETR
nr:GNAT family N-acetyltransferase [Halovulum dunhuangense]